MSSLGTYLAIMTNDSPMLWGHNCSIMDVHEWQKCALFVKYSVKNITPSTFFVQQYESMHSLYAHFKELCILITSKGSQCFWNDLRWFCVSFSPEWIMNMARIHQSCENIPPQTKFMLIQRLLTALLLYLTTIRCKFHQIWICD